MTATTQPKLLYFYSPTSGLSRRVEAFLDQVLQERRNHTAFTRARVDVERTPQLAQHFSVADAPDARAALGCTEPEFRVTLTLVLGSGARMTAWATVNPRADSAMPTSVA